MKTIKTKLLVTGGAALAGLIVYDVSMKVAEMFRWIDKRHPEMGVGGWLLFGLWALSAAAIGIISDHFWRDKTLFLPGDAPIALMLLYMTVSALIYMIIYGA